MLARPAGPLITSRQLPPPPSFSPAQSHTRRRARGERRGREGEAGRNLYSCSKRCPSIGPESAQDAASELGTRFSSEPPHPPRSQSHPVVSCMASRGRPSEEREEETPLGTVRRLIGNSSRPDLGCRRRRSQSAAGARRRRRRIWYNNERRKASR